MPPRTPPPWLNRKLNSKLAAKRRLKAKGLAPIPKTKAAQRKLAEWTLREPDNARQPPARALSKT